MPLLTLVWMYEGSDAEARRAVIGTLEYPHVDVVATKGIRSLSQLASIMSPDSEVCVFWADDDKPVRPDFLSQMVQPLFADGAARAAMHLWSGNAVAMPRAAFQAVQGDGFQLLGNSFMKLALLFLDVGSVAEGARAHVAFSSTERLAPLCGEPVGLPS